MQAEEPRDVGEFSGRRRGSGSPPSASRSDRPASSDAMRATCDRTAVNCETTARVGVDLSACPADGPCRQALGEARVEREADIGRLAVPTCRAVQDRDDRSGRRSRPGWRLRFPRPSALPRPAAGSRPRSGRSGPPRRTRGNGSCRRAQQLSDRAARGHRRGNDRSPVHASARRATGSATCARPIPRIVP